MHLRDTPFVVPEYIYIQCARTPPHTGYRYTLVRRTAYLGDASAGTAPAHRGAPLRSGAMVRVGAGARSAEWTESARGNEDCDWTACPTAGHRGRGGIVAGDGILRNTARGSGAGAQEERRHTRP